MAPTVCPVCCGDHIRAIERKAVIQIESEQNPISGVMAFRCGNGHVFLAAPAEKDQLLHALPVAAVNSSCLRASKNIKSADHRKTETVNITHQTIREIPC